MATSTQHSGTVVAGYFATGHAAHRAINALIEAGFAPNEIGAAFHVQTGGTVPGAGAALTGAGAMDMGREPSRQPDFDVADRSELGKDNEQSLHTRTGSSGAASGSNAVQYAALGGGAGTPFDGAGSPGPIPGSSLHNTSLPSELKSELPHDGDLQGTGARAGSSATGFTPGQESSFSASPMSGGMASQSLPISSAPGATTGSLGQTGAGSVGAARGDAQESWGSKLKHIFGGGDRAGTEAAPAHAQTHVQTHAAMHDKDDLRAEMNKEAQDFGTGEGHLMLNTPRRYSQPAFERSFSSYGVQPERARSFSQQLGRGGAVVTVHAAGRAAEAERVMEAHGGQVSLTGTGAAESAVEVAEVEVFGTVGRDYPGFFD